jgi:methyl-accepting chemotaxis protein
MANELEEAKQAFEGVLINIEDMKQAIQREKAAMLVALGQLNLDEINIGANWYDEDEKALDQARDNRNLQRQQELEKKHFAYLTNLLKNGKPPQVENDGTLFPQDGLTLKNYKKKYTSPAAAAVEDYFADLDRRLDEIVAYTGDDEFLTPKGIDKVNTMIDRLQEDAGDKREKVEKILKSNNENSILSDISDSFKSFKKSFARNCEDLKQSFTNFFRRTTPKMKDAIKNAGNEGVAQIDIPRTGVKGVFGLRKETIQQAESPYKIRIQEKIKEAKAEVSPGQSKTVKKH